LSWYWLYFISYLCTTFASYNIIFYSIRQKTRYWWQNLFLVHCEFHVWCNKVCIAFCLCVRKCGVFAQPLLFWPLDWLCTCSCRAGPGIWTPWPALGKCPCFTNCWKECYIQIMWERVHYPYKRSSGEYRKLMI
jgi:hypothetical protein